MNPYDVYRQQDLETCNKQELVAKLYNKASISLKRAIKSIDEKKLDLANSDIQKAQLIVRTLNDSLDMEFPISEDLRKLYTYMIERLFDANINKDKAILEELSKMLAELRDTWLEAIKRSRKLQSS